MRFFVFFILVFCLSSPAFAEESVPLVENPREAPRVSVVQFEEVWQAGADDSEEFLFGVISDAVCDQAGNLYLLDTQQQQVFKFSSAGQFMGLVSRKGEGPGEINLVYSLLAPGEGRLAMPKGFPAKVVLVDTIGTPLPGIDITLAPIEGKAGGFPMLYGLAFTGDHLVIMGQVMHGDGIRQDNTTFVSRFDPDGQETTRYAEWSSGYDFSQAIKVDELADFQPFNHWDMDALGHVYHLVEREAYLIQVISAEGEPLFRIQREWPVHQRTSEEKDKAKDNYSFGSSGNLPPISYDMAGTDAAISSLEIQGDELWVTSPLQEREAPPEVSKVVSVFDLEGNLIEDRHFVVPRNKGEDRLRYLPDGRVVRVKAFYSAHAAASVGTTVQQGEKRPTSDDHDEEMILEVIVYQPVSR